MTKKIEIVEGKFVSPYECANIGNNDYTTYPVDAEGKVTQVDVIENGKLLKFITPAKARMDKQIADNLKVSVDETDESSSDEPSTTEEQTPVETELTDKTAESPAGEPEEPPTEGQTETSGKE